MSHASNIAPDKKGYPHIFLTSSGKYMLRVLIRRRNKKNVSIFPLTKVPYMELYSYQDPDQLAQ